MLNDLYEGLQVTELGLKPGSDWCQYLGLSLIPSVCEGLGWIVWLQSGPHDPLFMVSEDTGDSGLEAGALWEGSV